ncbi:MAG: siderophore-interacting protein [Granulosicoccus sp.]
MATRRKAKQLVVSNAFQLTPNMRRITLRGDALGTFPQDAAGTYFKLAFPGNDGNETTLRTYTVSQHRPEMHEIDVDFMLHADSDGNTSGVAAAWSIKAEEGDTISIFGPGSASFINPEANWYLLAADMTALPALTANLTRLPADAKGYVVVEIISREDEQPLPLPVSMEIIWVVNPEPGSDDSALFHAIKKLPWLSGSVSSWTACEFKTMKKIRHYLRNERMIEKSHIYISSYWKKGLQEEEHKIVKRQDAA